MPSFFSVRLAPGVRISASSRGLRAHVGPRGARLHVGGGRTGVSTGAAGHVLLSVKETLATAVGASSVTVVAVRREEVVEAVFAGQIERSDLARASFRTEDAWTLLGQAAREQRVSARGVTRSLQALDLTDELELLRLGDAVDGAEPA